MRIAVLDPSTANLGCPQLRLKSSMPRFSAGALRDEIAESTKTKPSVVKAVLGALNRIVIREIGAKGKYIVPGMARFNMKMKPATEAAVKNIFGKQLTIKARAATKVLKAAPAKQLKDALL